MLLANIIDEIVGYLCFGGIGFLFVIGLVLYSIGSAVGSFLKNDTVQEAAKEVAEEVANGAIITFLESFFDD